MESPEKKPGLTYKQKEEIIGCIIVGLFFLVVVIIICIRK